MTVIVSMSAVCIKLTTLLCLFFTALSASGKSGVENKNPRESITIQCTCRESDLQSLELRKGLNKEVQVLYHDGESKKLTIATEFQDRLQVFPDKFPAVQIFIKNLTFDDTGPYWCLYQMFDQSTSAMKQIKGNGSVLLVVQGDGPRDMAQCGSSKDQSFDFTVIAVFVGIFLAVLLSIFMGFLILWIKKKTAKPTKKPRRSPNCDVYEDMRGTRRH